MGGAPGSTARGSRTKRLAAISIDLDEVHHYRAIYGLPALPRESRAARAVFEVALPRALGWAERHGARLSLFAVSDDLRHAANVDVLSDALARGHEVESHSASHPYDLVRRSRAELTREVGASFDAIERALGSRPRGFRAPGYTLSDELLDAVESAGALFDASLLPSPPYYLAKLAALGALESVGRRSASIVGPMRPLFGPTEPYRPGRPYWERGERELVEIPMRVTPWTRLPVIGTSLGVAGPRVARALVRACRDQQTFSLELHGMDFLERTDGLEELAPHVPELGTPLVARLGALDAGISELAACGFELTTLREIARGVC